MKLDLGTGAQLKAGFTSLDKYPLPGIGIVHDLEIFPWPLADGSCDEIRASHIVEHIKPWLTVDFFNEMWRVLVSGGKAVISTPYAGSPEFWQDPTHCNGFTEVTFEYFDIISPLYDVYVPRPWQIVDLVKGQYLEVVMQKVAQDD